MSNTQKAFVEGGLIKDIGPDMPNYRDEHLTDVPLNAQRGMAWDGVKAAWPDPHIITLPAPSGDPVERLQAFFAADPEAFKALKKLAAGSA